MSSRVESMEPQTVDEARDAVERSRQRISDTLDRLEDRIVDKKHELQDRMDVMRPVREQVDRRPFTAVAVGLGVGALLGALSGRDHDEHEHGHSHSHPHSHSHSHSHHRHPMHDGMLSAEERADLREWRRHRRRHMQSAGRSRFDSDDESRFEAVRHQLMGALTAAIGSYATAKVKEFAGLSDGGRSRGMRGERARLESGSPGRVTRGYERDHDTDEQFGYRDSLR